MLGLVFKCVRKKAHPKLNQLVELQSGDGHGYRTRTAATHHDGQLVDVAAGCHLDKVKRSFLGLVKAYNLLAPSSRGFK